MKNSLISLMRVISSLAVVCILVVKIDVGFAMLDMNTPRDTFKSELIFFPAAPITEFCALFAGGLIAKQRFVLAAAIFALILRFLSLVYFADFGDRSLQDEFTRSWTDSLAFVIFAVVAAAAGVAVRRVGVCSAIKAAT